METEIWKDIPWYEGKYQVSNLGRVKKIKTSKRSSEKILKHWLTTSWYCNICLYNNWIPKMYSIHRLVLLAFIWKSDLDVNHKDWNKQNNYINNLEYTSKSYNIKHSIYILWNKNSVGNNKKKIEQYDLLWNKLNIFNTIKEAWDNLWIKDPTSLSACCKWKQKTAYWFKWKYI